MKENCVDELPMSEFVGFAVNSPAVNEFLAEINHEEVDQTGSRPIDELYLNQKIIHPKKDSMA